MRNTYRDVTLAVEDRHWWYRGRRAIVQVVLDSLELPPGARSLDAGCGGGGNLPDLATLGPVTGLEPSSTAAAQARERGVGTIVEGRIEQMPFDNASFDLALALDVIEHLDDDVAGFRELRRVVGAGGFLVITVPAYPGLFGPHDVANEHRRRYLRSTLLAAAGRAGWRPTFVTHFNSLLLPAMAPHRLLQRRRYPDRPPPVSDFERTPRWLDGALELPLRAEARMLSAGVRIPAGLSIVAAFEGAARAK